MQDVVDPSERITRYLRNSGHIRPGLGRPHFNAYLPRVQNGDISVYRTDDLSTADIEVMGAAYVGNTSSPLKGHCDLLASDFFAESLNIESVPTPHERHANAVGWMTDPKNRIIAKKLADRATLTIYL